MDIATILSLGQTALELGLICSLTVLALYLSYSMLNVCDLSTDGCFTLGATVGAAVAIAGHPYLALPAAMAAGVLSGLCTALLQTKMGVNSLLSGINVNRVKLGVYALMGAVVAIAAVLQVSRIGAMDPANAGSGYELDSIAAVIVGGTSMSGGKGSVVGTVFGMLIIAVMNNLLNLLGVPPFLREAFKGAIIIAAVLLQRKSSDN